MLPPTYLHLPGGRPARLARARCWPPRPPAAGRDLHAGGRGARRRGCASCRSPTGCGRWSSDVVATADDGLVRRGVRRSRAVCVLAPNAGADDARRHQHLGAARAGRGRGRWSSTPGRPIAGAPRRRARRRPATSRVVLLTHHHLDHSEAAAAFAERHGLRGARARPGVPARLRGPRRRRRGRGRRPRGARRRDARPHRRLAVVRAARGACGAHRRHRARPRHDGRRAPGRPARARTSTRCDRLHALAEAHEIDGDLARPRPGDRRRPAGARPLPRAPQASGSTRSARPLRSLHAAARDGSPLDDERCPARIVEIVYADVDEVLWRAAELSVRAQLGVPVAAGGDHQVSGERALPTACNAWEATTPATVVHAGRRGVRRGQRARRWRRSTSMITTERGSRRSQPREAKSASALLTVSREAPTSWASSSWVRSWWTWTPSSAVRPKRSARSSSALATRPGTSEKTRSATTSLALRSRPASWASRPRATVGRPSSQRSRSSWDSEAKVGVGDRGDGRRARAGVEQRELAEHLAGAEDGQQVLAAVGGGAAELHLAVEHDVEPVARVALVEQHVAAAQPGLGHRGAQRGGRLVVERAEQRRLTQHVVVHGSSSDEPRRPRTSVRSLRQDPSQWAGSQGATAPGTRRSVRRRRLSACPGRLPARSRPSRPRRRPARPAPRWSAAPAGSTGCWPRPTPTRAPSSTSTTRSSCSSSRCCPPRPPTSGSTPSARRCSPPTPTPPRWPPPTATHLEQIIGPPASSGPRPSRCSSSAQALVERHDGEVPARLDDLVDAARRRPQDRQRRARQRLRHPRHHRRHPLRPAGPPLRLDRRRPTRSRSSTRSARCSPSATGRCSATT